ncbi:TetR/AcrR family transcriptional regulator [Flavivirga spongiicola]|uniref:TetR/AcrR family transcriptional regulator n=1 Tax=Flavivirga spongiicola TaxID=421621 RepID=A0ABU7XWG7_9FLAO|nr:TetR/AcrR family transcriptional regulator [Flavivirga sp. MEBiC05379]MDO5979848.1 TetR/AcrR family transcriptional regulator [Flavivirga sp. MEBiC05379]
MKRLGVKERIIETASDLFYHNGYNQTGINQIIAEAGVAKASMYQHFRSKEDIAVAYLVGRHTIWMGKLFDFISTERTSKGKIIRCFDYLIDWLGEVDFRGCGWQNIITDLPIDHDKIRIQAINHKNEVRNYIHDILKSETEYTIEQAEQLGDQILILIEGAIILSQIQKNKWPILAAKNASISLLK